MSTAQTLRDAAVTWPLPYLSDEESQVIFSFFAPHERMIFLNSTEGRTFLLFVACALDGGDRHHGIGVKP